MLFPKRKDKEKEKEIEEEQEEEMPEDEDNEYEPVPRDITGVLDKVISPKAFDKEVTRDLKLTKTKHLDRIFLLNLRGMIQKCDNFGLTDASVFFRKVHNYYVNLLSSDMGFTALNLISTKQYKRTEFEKSQKKKEGLFG